MSFTGIPELKQGYRQFGAARFWLIILAVFAWIGIGLWLQLGLHWRDHYGFQCHGRGCFLSDLWHSPTLLKHGAIGEYALFLWMWSMPASVAAAVIWARLRKRRHSVGRPPAEDI